MSASLVKVEEPFLGRAREFGTNVRLSLSNRDKLGGVIATVARYDITLTSGGQSITLPKKEISHISHSKPLIDESEYINMPKPAGGASRSRVQDEFLYRYVAEKTLALLIMVNGDELRGVICSFDDYTILVNTSRGQVLLYKHGLCTIGPGYRRRPDRENAR